MANRAGQRLGRESEQAQKTSRREGQQRDSDRQSDNRLPRRGGRRELPGNGVRGFDDDVNGGNVKAVGQPHDLDGGIGWQGLGDSRSLRYGTAVIATGTWDIAP